MITNNYTLYTCKTWLKRGQETAVIWQKWINAPTVTSALRVCVCVCVFYRTVNDRKTQRVEVRHYVSKQKTNSTGPQKNTNKQSLRPRKETGWEAQAGVLREPEESVQTRPTMWDSTQTRETWAREDSRWGWRGVKVARWAATVSFFQNKKRKSTRKKIHSWRRRHKQNKNERTPNAVSSDWLKSKQLSEYSVAPGGRGQDQVVHLTGNDIFNLGSHLVMQKIGTFVCKVQIFSLSRNSLRTDSTAKTAKTLRLIKITHFFQMSRFSEVDSKLACPLWQVHASTRPVCDLASLADLAGGQ